MVQYDGRGLRTGAMATIGHMRWPWELAVVERWIPVDAV